MVGDRGKLSSERDWYVLRSKPRREASAAVLLRRGGIEVYVPQLKVQKQLHRPPTVEPLFPGYLFGRLDPQKGEIRLAQYTPGILYVVGFGAEPCPVPNELILSIQERIARGWKGRVEPEYRQGERVVIASGPLRDVEAIFDRKLSPKGRVRVLVKILSRLCGVEVHVGQLRRSGKAMGTA